MEEEYLVLQCPACAKDVKVRSDSAGTRMGCPYCSEPLETIEVLPEDGEVPVEYEPGDKPVRRLPIVFRRIDDADLAGDPTYEARPQHGFRRGPEYADEYMRRRYPFEAPEWDEEISGQEGASNGGGADDGIATAEGVVAGEGGVAGDAPRAGRRKKLLTRREQDFRSIAVVILATAIVTVGIIVYSAVVRTVSVVRHDDKTMKELPEEVQRKIAEVTANKTPISLFMTSAEEEAAIAIVNGFLRAKSVEDRLPFVRDAERVEPLMKEWYSGGDPMVDWPEGKVLLRDKRVDQGRYFICLAIEFVGFGNRVFAVEETQEDLKLDWETAIGYQPMPLAEFVAKRPAAPVEFRVKLKVSDYYNFKFDDPGQYQAVELSYPGRLDFKLIGYIKRSREWAPSLIGRLEGGEAPSLIVELQHPGDEFEGAPQVEIISIISESWWL